MKFELQNPPKEWSQRIEKVLLIHDEFENVWAIPIWNIKHFTFETLKKELDTAIEKFKKFKKELEV